MKITINYETNEAVSVIDAIKATIDMYEGFGLDTDKLQTEMNTVIDSIIDGTWNRCADCCCGGVKVDAKTKTIEFVIDNEVFCNNMKLSTMILKKMKPIVTMVKSICEVAHDITTSIKESVKKATFETLKRGETMDKSYMVKVLDIEGHKVTAMARFTRWNTIDVVEANISGETPEFFRKAILEEVTGNPKPEDWANKDLMNLADARKQYEALSGSKSEYQIGEF